MFDKETKEVVQKVHDINYKRVQEERENRERDIVKTDIRNTMNEYSIDRHSAELYIKYEESRNRIIGIVIGCLMFIILIICWIELVNGPGYWLGVLGSK